jgi:hypothetical protein
MKKHQEQDSSTKEAIEKELKLLNVRLNSMPKSSNVWLRAMAKAFILI